jgi:hypothetical protein
MTSLDLTFLTIGILAIVAMCLWSVDRELTERARRQRLQRQIALLDDAVSEAGVIRIFNFESGRLGEWSKPAAGDKSPTKPAFWTDSQANGFVRSNRTTPALTTCRGMAGLTSR